MTTMLMKMIATMVMRDPILISALRNSMRNRDKALPASSRGRAWAVEEGINRLQEKGDEYV
jgi:hypothetical protein